MNFPQVYRRVLVARSMLSLWNFYADMEFKATVPHQRTCTAVRRQIERQHNGCASSAHWQDDTPFFFAHRLFRPMNGVELLHFVGIAHLWVCGFQLAGGLDIGKKSMDHHLYRLAMERILAFGGLLQFITPRPFGLGGTRLFVEITAGIPHQSRFPLCCGEASEECL